MTDPIDIAIECMTNKDWGLGLDPESDVVRDARKVMELQMQREVEAANTKTARDRLGHRLVWPPSVSQPDLPS